MNDLPARPRCAALVLAAGRGTRFGSDKRKALLADGRMLLTSTLQQVQASFDPVYLVLRSDDDPQAWGIDAAVHIVRAEQAANGMGASLAAGAAALAQADIEIQAVAVLLGDMPWIAPQTFEYLLQHVDAQRILVPSHQGRRGHPVIFGRRFWPALRELQGDQGGRALIEGQPQACQVLEIEDPGILRDIDTPLDLASCP